MTRPRRSEASSPGRKARTSGVTWSCSPPPTAPGARPTPDGDHPPTGDSPSACPPTGPVLAAADAELLLDLLGEAQRRGFLGPGPIQAHLPHSLAFVRAWSLARTHPPHRLLDLGSGGGVPGLVLGRVWPEAHLILVDANLRRTAFLEEAAARLDRPGRTDVLIGRAEELAHGQLRERCDYVTARGFGPPPVAAECAAGFLAPEGLLAVAEPPTPESSRWPGEGLRRAALTAVGRVEDPAAVAVFRRHGPLDARLPRRVGIPAKRPLWSVAD
ncbi:hypothetical protein GHK86_19115 [Acidimicrobiaceae bacterium USS-CC1]|uniref:Ribosomal RNA small subunit methyltransferase G n=1 Tax=Acidiferrimicrobium australe TaxID=2664430 RepID=A0ABW9QZD5_9ACTN|nr:hypothetical protein [Acidiferrimicrobium australe]